MGGEIEKLSYEEWLLLVFDHPAGGSEPEWYFELDDDWYNPFTHPREVVQYITSAFETITDVAKDYSDTQLNQGLWYILSNGLSDYMFALLDENVPWEMRLRCIRSFYCVFRDLFLPRCTPHLGHTQRAYNADQNPLNSVCYMWWDLLPIAGDSSTPLGATLNDEFLTLMEQELALESIACQEGALHGLGHWARHVEGVEAIIDAYLNTNPTLMPELRNYALSAKGGCVL